MKRKIIIILVIAAVFAVSIFPYFMGVGRFSGIENENVIITTGSFSGEYIISECEHSANERGRVFGKIDGGNFDAYAYKTSCEKGCIYVASAGRGEFYTPSSDN